MSHHSNQAEVDDISTKLKFISLIGPNQRVNIGQGLSLHSKYSWQNRFRRTYLGTESRQATYEFIKETINRSYELLLSLRHSSSDYDMQVYRKIIMELMSVETGIRSLIETYQNDPEYVSILSTLIDSLQIKIRELCDYKEIDLAELTLELQTELAKAEAAIEAEAAENEAEVSEKKKIQTLIENLNDGSESSDNEASAETDDGETEQSEVEANVETDPADNESESEETEAEVKTEVVETEEAEDHELPLGLDAIVPPIPQEPQEPRVPTPIFDNFTQSSEQLEPISTPPTKTPVKKKAREIPMESNPELLELLNKVNLGPRRRNRRRKALTPPNRAKNQDENPYSVLKQEFTYDLESGLQPPRAPLKRKVV